MNFERRILISFLIYIFISGCVSNQSIELINLDTSKKIVQEYYESGKFDEECRVIIDDAIKQIGKLPLVNNSTVVFDVDETALSNYSHTKEIGFGFEINIWNQWLMETDGTAIYHTKRFYDWLISKNVKVIFLTGRYALTREATIKNLIEQGFTKFDTLIVRSPEEEKIPAAVFKPMKREELAKKGYNIIACIGDQWSDLNGDNAGIKIKLPNYLYIID